MAYCENCGNKLLEGAKFCTNCGTPVNKTNNRNGNLHIRWKGQWALIDSKVNVFVNEGKIGEYSFKKGFQLSVPIIQQEIVVETRLNLIKSKCTMSLLPEEDYFCELLYDTTLGKFDFRLTDSDSMIIH